MNIVPFGGEIALPAGAGGAILLSGVMVSTPNPPENLTYNPLTRDERPIASVHMSVYDEYVLLTKN